MVTLQSAPGMTSIAEHDSPYTLLETLLLFHNLTTHGPHPSSFSLISNILLKNPLVCTGETYDRSRLSPDALQQHYLVKLQEAQWESGDDGTAVSGSPRKRRMTALQSSEAQKLINKLTLNLSERYKRAIVQKMRDEEKRYVQLQRELKEITAGLWDERLLREHHQRTRSRSASAVGSPARRSTLSPVVETPVRRSTTVPPGKESPPIPIDVALEQPLRPGPDSAEEGENATVSVETAPMGVSTVKPVKPVVQNVLSPAQTPTTVQHSPIAHSAPRLRSPSVHQLQQFEEVAAGQGILQNQAHPRILPPPIPVSSESSPTRPVLPHLTPRTPQVSRNGQPSPSPTRPESPQPTDAMMELAACADLHWHTRPPLPGTQSQGSPAVQQQDSPHQMSPPQPAHYTPHSMHVYQGPPQGMRPQQGVSGNFGVLYSPQTSPRGTPQQVARLPPQFSPSRGQFPPYTYQVPIQPMPHPHPLPPLQGQPQHQTQMMSAQSPRKVRPPPIQTGAPVSPVSIPFARPPFDPGSPIPPGPEDISPISTPPNSPPPFAPRTELASPSKTHGRKRPAEDFEVEPPATPATASPDDVASVKRHKPNPVAIPSARSARGSRGRGGRGRGRGRWANRTIRQSSPEPHVEDTTVEPEKPEPEAAENEEPTPTPAAEQPPETPSRKRRRSVQSDSGDDLPSPQGLPMRKPTPRPAPLQQQTSTLSSMLSPAPNAVSVGQQPMVVATKKFAQLTTPLLGNIFSHKFANLFSAPVAERLAPGYKTLIYKPQDLKSIKAAVKAGAASLLAVPSSTGTPTTDTPPHHFPFTTSTSIITPATTANTPPKGIVNSLQLEKELFRMFANAVMYNKSNSEIVKETVEMAKDVQGMVDNFRAAEEAGTRKALMQARELGKGRETTESVEGDYEEDRRVKKKKGA